jgi:hypothetical protein
MLKIFGLVSCVNPVALTRIRRVSLVWPGSSDRRLPAPSHYRGPIATANPTTIAVSTSAAIVPANFGPLAIHGVALALEFAIIHF